MVYYWDLSFQKNMKKEKKAIAELGHSDLLSVLWVQFCQNASISRNAEPILAIFSQKGL